MIHHFDYMRFKLDRWFAGNLLLHHCSGDLIDDLFTGVIQIQMMVLVKELWRDLLEVRMSAFVYQRTSGKSSQRVVYAGDKCPRRIA